MKIGCLATAAGTSVESIRFYEREGLLATAVRTTSNYRTYGSADVQRLHFIRRCRSLDMTLPEIRELLDLSEAAAKDCEGVNRLLDEHIGHVADRIRELRALERELKELRARCAQPNAVDQCGILRGLAQGKTHDPISASAERKPSSKLKPDPHQHTSHLRRVHGQMRHST